ncbi:MAG TPA: DNA polymerase/3'-5' exonuclease PolX [Thermoanaerobaculia bacterium]|nr:DNA polymerase/3'-5' exonuclease PolX [Thermoanaerobaculia bacterium]
MDDRKQIARALDEIARYLEVGEGNRFKARAYANAARVVERLEIPIDAFISSGAIDRTPGIGKATGGVIREIAESGHSSYLESLRKEYPEGLFALARVPGLGPAKVAALHELGISSVEDLERACREGALTKVKGFGARTQQKLLKSIEILATTGARYLLPLGLELADLLTEAVSKVEGVESVEVAGSVRRRLETIAEVAVCAASSDLAASTKGALSLSLLHDVSAEEAVVKGAGPRGIPVRIRFCSADEFPSTLLFETGTEEFVEALVERAAAKDLSLQEDGLRAGRKRRALGSERDLFRAIGVPWVEPELRESDEFVERAKPPRRLVSHEHIRGVFHVHTTYSDGRATMREMLDEAESLGLEYVGISDHSKAAYYARGLDVTRLDEQQAEIESNRKAFPSMRLLKGTEADILLDGSIDYDTETLKRFDFVVASIHSRFSMGVEEMTERIVRALSNPFVTFLGHPTGRLLLSRPGYQIDFDRIFDAAAASGVMIEINGNPHRLDIDWRLLRRGLERGVTFSIHPDAHSTAEMGHIHAGCDVARKGGLGPEHIFNTRPVDEVVEFLEKRRKRAIAGTRTR